MGFSYAAVAATLVLLGTAKGDVNFEVQLGPENACLTEINKARNAVGFPDFEVVPEENFTKRLPTEGEALDWQFACRYLLQSPADLQSSQEGGLLPGTYAWKTLTGNTPDCSAIVQQWTEAFKNFTGLPPKPPNALYKNPENVSFVALYNPGTPESAPVADCRVVTCTEKILLADPIPPKKTGSALVCYTTPDLFRKKEPPFTQEQWDKISSVLASAASTAVPSFLLFAAAAIGLSLL